MDDELLALRICDLGVSVERSDLHARIGQLHDELAAYQLAFRPDCYLSDEWFTQVGESAIAIPFYLAHPRLKALELKQMLEVEGGSPEECQRLLRHECGHAFDHAFRFSRRRSWRALFGRPDAEETPSIYRPHPYSRSFVVHLANWYAQAHPDEDFAETFAVCIGMPERQWRQRYRGWKALKKLEYVDGLLKEAAKMPSPRVKSTRVWEARRLKKRLHRYYRERRKLAAEDFPDFYDADLRALFLRGDPGDESAARFMRRNRLLLCASVVRWTGQRKYTVDRLLRRLMVRCESLSLPAPRDDQRLYLDVSAYLATLVTTHLHTGRFKRSV